MNLEADVITKQRQAIGILAKRGGRFTSADRGTKGGGLSKGWNKPENTLTLEQALTDLKYRRNIGLATGSGDLYCFDFDADADRGHECSHIAGTFYTYRVNALDRGKFFFQCDEPIPRKSQKNGVELCGWTKNGKHWNAVIAGVHSSGAPILWGGHQVVKLDKDTVAELWEAWSETPLEPPERQCSDVAAHSATTIDYGGTDLEIAADALNHIGAWSVDYDTWIAILGALHDTYGDAALDLAVRWGKGAPGEVEAKWKTFGNYAGGATMGTIWYLARQNGWDDSALRATARDQLVVYRQWLHSAAGAEALREAGFVRVEVGRKCLDALVDICLEWGQLSVRPGYRKGGELYNASQESVRRALEKLVPAGLVQIAKEEGSAATITLVLRNRDSNTHTSVGTTVTVTQNYFATYGDHRAHDAFIDNHAAYKKRVPDGLAPLGTTSLAVVAQLTAGAATAKQIAGVTGLSYGSVNRALNKAFGYGLLTVEIGRRNLKTYSLRDEWREDLAMLAPNMTTYGVLFRRQLANAEAQLAYARRQKDAMPARIDRLEDRVNRLASVITDIENPAQWVDPYRPGHTWIRWDKAEQNAELEHVRDQIQLMRLDGLKGPDIRRHMNFAGYNPQHVSRAMAHMYGMQEA